MTESVTNTWTILVTSLRTYISRELVERAARRKVEARVVPVAGQDAVVDAASIEREPHVRAAVVYGEDPVLVVEERDGVPFDVYDEAFLSLQFLEAGDADVRGDLAVGTGPNCHGGSSNRRIAEDL